MKRRGGFGLFVVALIIAGFFVAIAILLTHH